MVFLVSRPKLPLVRGTATGQLTDTGSVLTECRSRLTVCRTGKSVYRLNGVKKANLAAAQMVCQGVFPCLEVVFG